jgi:hypothetical protein
VLQKGGQIPEGTSFGIVLATMSTADKPTINAVLSSGHITSGMISKGVSSITKHVVTHTECLFRVFMNMERLHDVIYGRLHIVLGPVDLHLIHPVLVVDIIGRKSVGTPVG